MALARSMGIVLVAVFRFAGILLLMLASFVVLGLYMKLGGR